MTNKTKLPHALALLAIMALAAPPAAAETVRVPVRVATLHPATPAAARRLLARLGNGAMKACGAEPFSLRETQQAARTSACWREAMADAVRRIDSPLLTLAFTGKTRLAAACTKEQPCPTPSN